MHAHESHQILVPAVLARVCELGYHGSCIGDSVCVRQELTDSDGRRVERRLEPQGGEIPAHRRIEMPAAAFRQHRGREPHEGFGR